MLVCFTHCCWENSSLKRSIFTRSLTLTVWRDKCESWVCKTLWVSGKWGPTFPFRYLIPVFESAWASRSSLWRLESGLLFLLESASFSCDGDESSSSCGKTRQCRVDRQLPDPKCPNGKVPSQLGSSAGADRNVVQNIMMNLSRVRSRARLALHNKRNNTLFKNLSLSSVFHLFHSIFTDFYDVSFWQILIYIFYFLRIYLNASMYLTQIHKLLF